MDRPEFDHCDIGVIQTSGGPPLRRGSRTTVILEWVGGRADTSANPAAERPLFDNLSGGTDRGNDGHGLDAPSSSERRGRQSRSEGEGELGV